ncbi:hypothetical protein [Nostoc sp. ChiQUE01b]|nr:hypothetical protein [Nostoc sp. ChiQUE01b]MDZ8259110.1 hypothetical protein [Nostoc sp. ChiQUE01b]
MPNTIVLLKKADAKAGLQRAAMSTTGYAYVAVKDEDTIQFNFIQSS